MLINILPSILLAEEYRGFSNVKHKDLLCLIVQSDEDCALLYFPLEQALFCVRAYETMSLTKLILLDCV